jgi:hypothetical protein
MASAGRWCLRLLSSIRELRTTLATTIVTLGGVDCDWRTSLNLDCRVKRSAARANASTTVGTLWSWSLAELLVNGWLRFVFHLLFRLCFTVRSAQVHYWRCCWLCLYSSIASREQRLPQMPLARSALRQKRSMGESTTKPAARTSP